MSNIHFFLKSKLSQWSMVDMVVDGVKYCCCEQWMMAGKAKHFGDKKALREIMKAQHPMDHKEWGRKVKGYNTKEWHKVARQIVYDGNYAKFSQNPEYWEILDATGNKIMAEANPDDKVWGIGLPSSHPDAQSYKKWRGRNWLGDVLYEVRKRIRAERAGRNPGPLVWPKVKSAPTYVYLVKKGRGMAPGEVLGVFSDKAKALRFIKKSCGMYWPSWSKTGSSSWVHAGGLYISVCQHEVQ